jgi:hypothetical protein
MDLIVDPAHLKEIHGGLKLLSMSMRPLGRVYVMLGRKDGGR